MQPLFAAVPATTIAADGTCDVPVQGFPAGMGISKWNIALTLPTGIVTVWAGSTPIAGPMPATNGGITFGPVVSVSSDQIHVSVSGGHPGDTLQGSIRGGSGATLDDVASIVSIGSSTQGSAQNDPSRLLAGQVGDPLVENASFTVPNKNLNPNFVTFPAFPDLSFDMSGFGALFLVGDPNTSVAQTLFAQIVWYDSLGNQVDYDQLDALAPAFAVCLGAKGVRASISIFNLDTVNHGVSNFSAIPLVQIPARPELLLPNIGGVFGTFNPTKRGVLIDASGSTVAAGNFLQSNSNCVYAGRAIWTIGAGLTGAGGTAYNATLQSTAANGDTTILARVPATQLPPPIEVQLPTGQIQALYFNTGTGTQTIVQTLVAAS